ncbi:zinc finger protein 16 [Brachyistius frenatus]|uniref:zinc finger protein 16 n=1 Tax=Brachyistius frenatus TaxID=100188 RepID=UPI0037E7A458
MSEDSSADEDRGVVTESQVYDDACPEGRKCWECGKQISNLTNLMSHYKSHNIKATCHICKVTFRRLTSLSTHLDNAHLPPVCRKCYQSFRNVWELNKHAETNCTSSASFQRDSAVISGVIRKRPNRNVFSNELRPEQKIEMKPEGPETSENSVEYTVGEGDLDIDTESGSEKADGSTSSESEDEDKTFSKPVEDPESDGGSNSSSTDCSSDSSDIQQPKPTPAPSSNAKSSMCAVCGRGPFRSVKLHLLHCSGIKVKYQCFLCKKLFADSPSLNEHLMSFYSCDYCGQIFSHQNSYYSHVCPKGPKPALVLFCSESLPKACNICKSFFTSEKTLSEHVTRVHSSVVSTKVCIVTNPALLADKKGKPGVQSAISSLNKVNQVINGQIRAGQNFTGSLSAVVKSSPSPRSTPSHASAPPAPTCTASAAVKSRKVGAPDQPSSRLSSPSSVHPHGATDTTPDAAASEPGPPPSPTILAMFENDSQDVALMKRMNMGWRSKAPHPCRQCGAILRQPSLIISHRYLHRGRRLHQCQCGRAFKHRLHLLRHCVQHAEAVSYICVSCGDTFTGAKLLAQHLKGKSLKKSRSGRPWKSKVKSKCRMSFTCDCGQLFCRPSAYIWHQLKNRTKS